MLSQPLTLAGRRFLWRSSGGASRSHRWACVSYVRKNHAVSSATPDAELLKEVVTRVEASPALFQTLMETPVIQKAMMAEVQKIDTNMDGTISPEEFEHWVVHSIGRAGPAEPIATRLTREGSISALSREQKKRLAIQSAIPFIGFGFLDNAIMLLAGNEIDNAFSAFGISALACAALGNTVSDVAGIKAGGVIERVASKMGLPDPGLTMQQLKSETVKSISTWSSAVGIVIGCLLGMFPLLLMGETDVYKQMFDAVDMNKSGDINFTEIRFAMAQMGLKISDDALHEAFNQVSTDEKLNFLEFKQMVQNFEHQMASFKASDPE